MLGEWGEVRYRKLVLKLGRVGIFEVGYSKSLEGKCMIGFLKRCGLNNRVFVALEIGVWCVSKLICASLSMFRGAGG